MAPSIDLQLGETGLMVYALRTFGRVSLRCGASDTVKDVCVRPGACCGGVAEWLKAHSAPVTRAPSSITACAQAYAAEGWPSG